MKSLYLLAIFFGWTLVSVAGDANHKKIAFERDDGIWIIKADGGGAKEIINHAQSPDFSPDGSKIAYNTVQEAGKPAHRQIAIYDFTTGKSTILTAIPSDNAMEPLWSPDGNKLLFNYYSNNDRFIGLVNGTGTGFRSVPIHHKSYWGMTWDSDGTSFFADDMASIFQIDLNGKLLKKWAIQKVAPNGSMSGDCRMDVSPDGAYLLLDVDMDEPARTGWDGPPASIWELNLKTEHTKRLTAPSLYAWDCHWYSAPDSILCVSQKPNDQTQSIYWMSAQDGSRKALARDGSLPSSPK